MGIRGPVIGLGVAAIVGFGVSAVEPHFDHTQQDRNRTQQQQLLDQGAEAQQIENEQKQAAADDLRDGDARDWLRPGEYRPRVDLPEIHFRP